MAGNTRLDWARHHYDGVRLLERGDDAAAAHELRTAVRVAQRIRPHSSQNGELLGCSLAALAGAEEARHRYAEAARLYRRALGAEERALGPDVPYVAIILRRYAHLLRRLGRAAPAEAAQRRADGIWDKGYASRLDEFAPGVAA